MALGQLGTCLGTLSHPFACYFSILPTGSSADLEVCNQGTSIVPFSKHFLKKTLYTSYPRKVFVKHVPRVPRVPPAFSTLVFSVRSTGAW